MCKFECRCTHLCTYKTNLQARTITDFTYKCAFYFFIPVQSGTMRVVQLHGTLVKCTGYACILHYTLSLEMLYKHIQSVTEVHFIHVRKNARLMRYAWNLTTCASTNLYFRPLYRSGPVTCIAASCTHLRGLPTSVKPHAIH